MAECVVALTYDTDHKVLAPACNVHCSFALPCQHNGEPAKPTPMHTWATCPRAETVAFWWNRTHGQRPLVIHCIVWPDEHDYSEAWPYPGCPCGGEIIKPVQS